MQFTSLMRKVIAVIDGDSMKVELDLGYKVFTSLSVRLLNLDTPEKHTETRAEGEFVLDHVVNWVKSAKGPLFVISERLDKFGRSLAEVIWNEYNDNGFFVARHSLNSHLLGVKFARPYEGGKRADWTEEELAPIREAMEAAAHPLPPEGDTPALRQLEPLDE